VTACLRGICVGAVGAMGKATKRGDGGERAKAKAEAKASKAETAAVADDADKAVDTSFLGFLLRFAPRFIRILGTMLLLHFLRSYYRPE